MRPMCGSWDPCVGHKTHVWVDREERLAGLHGHLFQWVSNWSVVAVVGVGRYDSQYGHACVQLHTTKQLVSPFHHLLYNTAFKRNRQAVASLGLLSPGAASEGVTPYFFLKKLSIFFAHSSLLLISLSGVAPLPWRVSPRTFFYLSDFVYPLFFVNSATNFFSFGCHPWRVSPGAAPSPSDATAAKANQVRIRSTDPQSWSGYQIRISTLDPADFQNVMRSCLTKATCLIKFSSRSSQYFWSEIANRRTDRQTDRQTPDKTEAPWWR